MLRQNHRAVLNQERSTFVFIFLMKVLEFWMITFNWFFFYNKDFNHENVLLLNKMFFVGFILICFLKECKDALNVFIIQKIQLFF